MSFIFTYHTIIYLVLYFSLILNQFTKWNSRSNKWLLSPSFILKGRKRMQCVVWRRMTRPGELRHFDARPQSVGLSPNSLPASLLLPSATDGLTDRGSSVTAPSVDSVGTGQRPCPEHARLSVRSRWCVCWSDAAEPSTWTRAHRACSPVPPGATSASPWTSSARPMASSEYKYIHTPIYIHLDIDNNNTTIHK